MAGTHLPLPRVTKLKKSLVTTQSPLQRKRQTRLTCQARTPVFTWWGMQVPTFLGENRTVYGEKRRKVHGKGIGQVGWWTSPRGDMDWGLRKDLCACKFWRKGGRK